LFPGQDAFVETPVNDHGRTGDSLAALRTVVRPSNASGATMTTDCGIRIDFTGQRAKQASSILSNLDPSSNAITAILA
jgi:hypothetical protein